MLCQATPALAAPWAQADSLLRVQAFLDGQPGPLKIYSDGRQGAAAIIESAGLYYGLSPRLHLALLEAVSGLLSTPAPPDSALRQPFGPAGPLGFEAQIEWASKELRAGLGPYDQPPTLRFSDGTTVTLSLAQAPEGVAVQRFLAIGRSQDTWRLLVERFNQAFQLYFNNELPEQVESQGPVATEGFLALPWPAGTPMVHLAYFDHAYPTVDSGGDGNGYVVTYLGRSNVQYNRHDGHDFYFPAQPIGTPILAAAPGVAYARTVRGNGVVIRHAGGYETVYWHLNTFALIFSGLVDGGQGVAVATGQFLGTSGRSGFVKGSPHLHFEVRHNGRQVDPYGWYGGGDDPCASYAGCERSVWLWQDSLRGSYDLTAPDAPWTIPDTTAPFGTLTINPPADLMLLARFEGSAVPSVGTALPFGDGEVSFGEGYAGQGLRLPPGAGLTYLISDSLRLDAGTLSLWARLPAKYPQTSTGRHYLFAASSSPDDGQRVYTGTLALRRESGSGGPNWNFWTTPGSGAAGCNDLATADTLDPGWHHFAVSWDAELGRKSLYIDGALAATARGVVLPNDVGPLLQLGRFTFGGAASGVTFDDLAIFNRALADAEVAALAAGSEPLRGDAAAQLCPKPQDLPGECVVVSGSSRSQAVPIVLDINAADLQGGIMALQVGLDGIWSDPQPYNESLMLQLPPVAGYHTLAVRYFDRASNHATVTASLLLNLPPQAEVQLAADNGLRASLAISASDELPGLEMQLGPLPSFDAAPWQPLAPEINWAWGPVRRRILYVRFRDAGGLTTAPLVVGPDAWRVWLPTVAGPL